LAYLNHKTNITNVKEVTLSPEFWEGDIQISFKGKDGVAVPLKAEGSRLPQSEHDRHWYPSDNLGGSISPRQLALMWDLPVRTVQRWAQSGSIPDSYTRGKRLLVRRTRASFEWMQSKARKASRRVLLQKIKKPEFRRKESEIWAWYNSTKLSQVYHPWKWEDPIETWPKWARKPSADLFDGLLTDFERKAMELCPARYGVMVAAAVIMSTGRFSMRRLHDEFNLSREHLSKIFGTISSSRLKFMARAILNSNMDAADEPVVEMQTTASGGSTSARITADEFPYDEIDERLGWSD
jgi:hypothetical protein